MRFLQSCKDLLQRHKKAARWVAFLLGMSLFFTILGMVTDPVNGIGFCKIYP
jgi:hypothetical protein